jgi:hypothetical protein
LSSHREDREILEVSLDIDRNAIHSELSRQWWADVDDLLDPMVPATGGDSPDQLKAVLVVANRSAQTRGAE